MTIQLMNELREREAWALSVVGASGSGKTHTSLYILRNWFPKDRVAFFHYPEEVLALLPDDLRKRSFSFEEYDELIGQDEPCIAFFDDTALFFLSRSGGNAGNKDIVQNMTIGRHNDLRYLITVQNLILLEKGFLESVDQFQLRSRMTLTQAGTEREEFRELQKSINTLLSGYPRKGYWYCPETDEVIQFPPLEWMTERISKPYKGAVIKNGQFA